MKVWEVMSMNYHKIKPSTLITEARAIFRKGDIRILIVTEDDYPDRLIGYILRRDSLTITSAKSNLPVREVLRDQPILTPDMDIKEAFDIMEKYNVDAIPVVDSFVARRILGF